MVINSPEFTLMELDILSDSGRGSVIKFSIPSDNQFTGRRQSDHPLQSRIQSVRQGVQLISQNILSGDRGGQWY